jgi:peptidyl-prolyl cis-trans isomerase C
LVKTPEDADMVLEQIASGTNTFAALATEFSTCPSAAQGGSLGSFRPGTMVPEFDEVIFSPDTQLGEVVGPVKTEVREHTAV